MRGVKEWDLPEKVCPVCGRPFRWRGKWRGKWRDDWGSVVYRSRRRRSAAQRPG